MPNIRDRSGTGGHIRAVAALWLVTLLIAPALARAGTPVTLGHPERLKKLSLEQLFDIEVTSVSQKPESLSKTAAAIHVVTQNDLHQMGARSIPEALRDIPGVEVARVDSRQYAITARGFNGTVANKLLVLIDGRSVYTPLYSGVFWDVQDTFLEDIEQIEVIRGPGATVWGANAVNGVINIRTKDAAHTQGWLVTGGGGNIERAFEGARFGGALGSNAFYRLYGKHFEREASVRPDGRDAGDDFYMSQGGFRLDVAPGSDNSFTLQGDGYVGSALQSAADETDMRGGNAIAQWTRHISTTSELELRGSYDRTERDMPSIFGETLDTYDLELRHRLAVGGLQDIVWGLGYRLMLDEVRNSPGLAFLPASLTRRLYSVFVQDEFRLAEDRLRLTVGSKFEHNDYTGFEYQPSARLAWAPVASHTVWAAASRAVRTPSRIDRDLYVPATPPYFLVGGKDFESEGLRAFEVGYKAHAATGLTASISTFYNLYDHLRSLEVGSPAFLANGLKARTYGLETEASYQVSDAWRLRAGYTYLELNVERTPGTTDFSGVRQEGDSPQHQSFIRSSLSLTEKLALDLSTRYVGNLPNQRVPAYATGDARLGWQLTDRFELELVGRDLLDPQHPEFGGPSNRREIQRSFHGKATCHF
jgi:iron complex outermembrane receptor protein